MSRVLLDAKNQITCSFSKDHKGVDLVKYKNKTCYVIAHSDGVVVWLQTGEKNNPNSTGNASYGNCVKLKHSDGYYTLYAHLKNVLVKKGQKVKKGDTIGYMGNTGKSFGSHLHFEVRNEKDIRIDPTKYLTKDLPIVYEYQVYDKKKKRWLPFVNTDSSDYAGNMGNNISALKISMLKYRVHDMVKKKWLPYVIGLESYAGNIKNNIDGVQILNARYRVHLKGGKWLSWVKKVDNTSDGYAGIYGKAIDAIQIKVK